MWDGSVSLGWDRPQCCRLPGLRSTFSIRGGPVSSRVRPCRASRGFARARDERALVEPGAGVPEPRAGECRPLGRFVAGQRAGSVGVAEDHVLGPRRERLRHARHGQQAGAAQLFAGELGARRGRGRGRFSAATALGIVTRPSTKRATLGRPLALTRRQTSRETLPPRASDAGDAPRQAQRRRRTSVP